MEQYVDAVQAELDVLQVAEEILIGDYTLCHCCLRGTPVEEAFTLEVREQRYPFCSERCARLWAQENL